MKIRRTGRNEKIELQMTPMIDVVFQMLIFFIMTFKIVLPEGDFSVRMPAADSAQVFQPSETLPLVLVMRADDDGRLADLQLSGRSLGAGPEAFGRLRQAVRALMVDAEEADTAAEQEIEIDADYHLHYDYVIRAITAVSGYIEGGQQHTLIERVKFTPPEEQRGGEGETGRGGVE